MTAMLTPISTSALSSELLPADANRRLLGAPDERRSA
jgi:hypothetical protein